MPTNLYGPGDNIIREQSCTSIINKKISSSKKMRILKLLFGALENQKGFLHVDDLASAIFYILNIPFDEYKYIYLCSHILMWDLDKIYQ